MQGDEGDEKDQANIIEEKCHLPPDFASDGPWCLLEGLAICSIIMERDRQRKDLVLVECLVYFIFYYNSV